MNDNKYLSAMRSEIRPALGCTEPVAVALAVAKARETLGCMPEQIVLRVSANILKNAMGVGIPGTGMVQILAENGVDVVYTRTTDVYQSPNRKAQIGNESMADLFVSLHRNASYEPNVYDGVQTLIYNTGDIKEEFANNINRELEEVGYKNIGTEVRTNLAVLSQTDMPSILVEAGFIDSDIDNRIWDEKFYQTANAIASGIIETIMQNS